MSENSHYYLYVHTNKINGKKYVGVTTQNPNKRWLNGRGYLHFEKGRYHQPKFANAIKKYGWDCFDHQVWELSSEADMLYAEKYLIKYYNTVSEGYNVTFGGDGTTGHKCSEEAKRKISEKNKLSLKGHNVSDDTRQKISSSRKGIVFSDRHIEKLSESHKGKIPSNSKPVIQILNDTIIAEYPSATAAGNALNLNRNSITACCKGLTRQYKKYEWKYKE